jgi:hypothetical protein
LTAAAELPLVGSGGGARTVRITARGKKLRIEGSADPRLTKTVAHMFRLDEDVSGFYALVRVDELASALGAGPMLRAPEGIRGRRQDDLHADTTTMRRPEWLPRRHNEYERAKGAP